MTQGTLNMTAKELALAIQSGNWTVDDLTTIQNALKIKVKEKAD
ncbi:MAG: hypothetical protein ACFFF4_09930 [Candidatus Thorarchaeota archaeon]